MAISKNPYPRASNSKIEQDLSCSSISYIISIITEGYPSSPHINKMPEAGIGIVDPETPSSHHEYANKLLFDLSEKAKGALYGSALNSSIEVEEEFTYESVVYYLEACITNYPILDETTLQHWSPNSKHVFAQVNKRQLRIPASYRDISWLPAAGMMPVILRPPGDSPDKDSAA